MDPDESLAAVRAIIARMPIVLAESAQPIPPGAFARRITWCSPAEGTQIAVLASVSASERPRGTPPLIVTIVELVERDERCDAPN
jgi:hypothetical protein